MRRLVTATLLLALGACDAAPPSFETGVEPETALRPEGQRGEVPTDARVADYDMWATLDAETHTIKGRAIITWRNRTRRTVTEVPFHLYMNGFRAEDTVWMAEARGSHRGQDMNKAAWGYIDIDAIRWRGQMPFAQADTVRDATEGAGEPQGTDLVWAEDADPSTMTVTLPEAVGPNRAIQMEIEFTTQLPEVFARTGYYEDFHMVGQWFPKIGVLEEEAGWKAHRFTLHSEFYADFGNYRVELDVPKEMVVGASGIRVGETVEGDRKKLSYVAEMVHDFAWVADPDFLEQWGEYEGIRIRQLIQPEKAHTADLHMAAQKFTLKSMQARFGPYPWSSITIVHPPEGAEGAGGMEYPTLYTSSDALGPSPAPWLFEERASGVFTTVHEFGHQYFQGLFASNEFAQPWLDEGMNTTSNALAYMDAYDAEAEYPDPWLVRIAGHAMTMGDLFRMSMLDALRVPVDQSAADYRDLVGGYGAMVYQKTGALMHTLRNLAGHAKWDEALTQYSAKARFRHPSGRVLEDTLVEVLGERVAIVGDGGPGTVWLDVQDFLDQALRDVSEVDFEVLSINNRKQVGDAGWHRDEAGTLVKTEGASDEGDGPVEGVVVVRRMGGFRVPVELMVEFEDGERQTVVWDGQARTHVFTWPDRRVRYALLDPSRKLLLEARRLNNSRIARETEHVQPPPTGLDDIVGDATQAAALAAAGAMAL